MNPLKLDYVGAKKFIMNQYTYNHSSWFSDAETQFAYYIDIKYIHVKSWSALYKTNLTWSLKFISYLHLL